MIKQILNHFNLSEQYNLVKAYNKDLEKDLNESLNLKDIDDSKSNIYFFRVRTNARAEYPEVNIVSVLLERKKVINVPVYSIENLKKHSEDLKLNIQSFEGSHGYGLVIIFSENENQTHKDESIFQSIEIVNKDFVKPIIESKSDSIDINFVKDKLGYPKNDFKNNKPSKR